jgi:hypothetical protein
MRSWARAEGSQFEPGEANDPIKTRPEKHKRQDFHSLPLPLSPIWSCFHSLINSRRRSSVPHCLDQERRGWKLGVRSVSLDNRGFKYPTWGLRRRLEFSIIVCLTVWMFGFVDLHDCQSCLQSGTQNMTEEESRINYIVRT